MAVIIQDVIKLMVMGNVFRSLETISEMLYNVMGIMRFFRETFVDTLEKLQNLDWSMQISFHESASRILEWDNKTKLVSASLLFRIFMKNKV